jgi:hypothetical protein
MFSGVAFICVAWSRLYPLKKRADFYIIINCSYLYLCFLCVKNKNKKQKQKQR